MAHKKNLLITFSGLDGAGKSTQINLLVQRLHTKGEHTKYFWSRGGYTGLMVQSKDLMRLILGRKIPTSGPSRQRTQMLRKRWVRQLWLMLAILDLIRIYGFQLRYWLWKDYTIICDRYIWDTLVDFQLNFREENIGEWWLWRILVRITPSPNASFLLLIPVDESINRSNIKGEPYRNSAEELAERLHQYENLSGNGTWYILDGRNSVTDLQNQIDIALANLASPT